MFDPCGVGYCYRRREGVGGHKPDGRNADQCGSDGAANDRSWNLTLCHWAGHGEVLEFGLAAA
jgi:hypothetical protein